MIIPLAIAITLSVNKIEINIPSHNEKYLVSKEIVLSQPSYFTTKDINQDPYTYIKEQNSSLLYKQIGEELLQDEEDNK